MNERAKTGAEILNEILAYENVPVAEFAKSVGLGSRVQALYDIRSGKTKFISASVASAIAEHRPMYNHSWLLTGRGEMFADGVPPIPAKQTEVPDTLTLLSHLITENRRLYGELSRASTGDAPERLMNAADKLDRSAESLIAIVQRMDEAAQSAAQSMDEIKKVIQALTQVVIESQKNVG